MVKKYNILLSFLVLLCSLSCDSSDETIIVPDSGYDWPSQQRVYWPTDGWRTSAMEDHYISPLKMDVAHQFAQNDPLTRDLLVIKDGYIVFENYYGPSMANENTNLWSVTKSFSSALIGILIDQNYVNSTNQLMSELIPDYPEFNEITLHHVLTMTTGLSWAEGAPLWDAWVFSDDWIASALARAQIHKPGEQFYYSSANSHFLTSLVYYSTGKAPGTVAKEQLFDPMGIQFDILDQPIVYNTWSDYKNL